MNRIFILHGWGGDATTNWFPWLKAYEEKKGNEVFVPNFPNTEFPLYDEWSEHWEELYATEIEKNSVFVCHSLGGAFLLRWLSENPVLVARLILVAPAPDDCGIDEIGSFFTRSWDVNVLKKNIRKIELLCSDNDPYIPLSKFVHLAKELEATLTKYSGKGHLNTEILKNLEEFL